MNRSPNTRPVSTRCQMVIYAEDVSRRPWGEETTYHFRRCTKVACESGYCWQHERDSDRSPNTRRNRSLEPDPQTEPSREDGGRKP